MRKRCLIVLLLPVLAGAAGNAFAAEPPRWPSLQRQLAQDRVAPGSALAKLVAENQDFHLLRPEEARDNLPVPPWLRVLWRKRHPETESSPNDRAGGYPHVLKEIHEWMLHHQDLRPGRPEPDVPPRPAKAVGVGPDLRISGDAGNPRSESDIRVNYWNPSQIIAASNNIVESGGQAQFYSRDAGRTWGQTTLPLLDGDIFHSDPTVDWTSDGTAWTVTIGITENFDLRLRAYKSTDGGATWRFDGFPSGGQVEADKQMIWVDHSEASPFKDNLYVIWHNGRRVYMSRRTPGGGWGEPVLVSGRETQGTGIGADVKVNRAGMVYGFWPDTATQKIFMVRSTNGGVSYSKPVSIAKTFAWYQIGVPAQSRRQILVYVTGGAWRSGNKDLVYAAWTDLDGGPTCRHWSSEPFENVASSCRTRIWFSRSTNGGRRWSRPRMIHHPPSLNDQFNPWLVVDEATGALAIIYYDTAGESRRRTNIWYQSSFDDGVTWSAPFRVTSAASDASAASGDINQYGDYNGLSGLAGTFFPAWTDRRSSGSGREEIWTAALVDRKSATCQTTELFAHGVGSGTVNVAVPEDAIEARLSFWHLRKFRSGANQGSLRISVDGAIPVPVPAWAVTSGAGAGLAGEALFTGVDDVPIQTTVDLDAVCNAAAGGAGGCAGRTLRLLFSAGADRSAAEDAWLLDDVSLTACTR
jgi:hypothetical protein